MGGLSWAAEQVQAARIACISAAVSQADISKTSATIERLTAENEGFEHWLGLQFNKLFDGD